MLPLVAGCGSDDAISAERTLDDAGSGGAGGSGAVDGSSGGSATGGSAGATAADGAAGTGAATGCGTATSVQNLSYEAGWDDFDDTSFVQGGFYADAQGNVHLDGVVSKLGGAPAQSDPIATLSDAYRPGERLVFPAFVKGHGRVDVTADGSLLWISGVASEQDYTSLAGVSFQPGIDAAAWSSATLGTWANYGGSYAAAAYRKDELDAVHLRGLVKKESAPTPDTIFTLPEAHWPEHRLLFLTTTSGGAPGRIDVVAADGSVVLYTGASGYVSLSGISFHVAAVPFAAPTLSGSWANYGGSHAPAGYYKDCLGRVHLRGLVTDSAGAPKSGLIFTLPIGHRPAAQTMFPVATRGTGSPLTTGRVDVHPDGRVMRVTGGTDETDWTSLTGISFLAAAP